MIGNKTERKAIKSITFYKNIKHEANYLINNKMNFFLNGFRELFKQLFCRHNERTLYATPKLGEQWPIHFICNECGKCWGRLSEVEKQPQVEIRLYQMKND